MVCPDLSVSEVELESRLEGRKVGMAATFSCPIGFNLRGPKRIACQKNGETERGPCLVGVGVEGLALRRYT